MIIKKMKSKLKEFKNRILVKFGKEKVEKIIKYSLIGLVLVIFIVLGFSSDKRNDIIVSGKENDVKVYYMVEVSGEVKSPGLYKVADTSCIDDLIRLSGGLTKNGTVDGINLAVKVSEGMRIVVPTIEEANVKVSINNCSLDDLINLGLTKTKAQTIINYRTKNIWISYIDELTKISGITESDYNQIKEFIIL